jgi:chitinase
MPIFTTHQSTSITAQHQSTFMMMASRRRLALVSVAACLVLSLLAGTATAKKTGQVTVFWGRNKNEGSLRET